MADFIEKRSRSRIDYVASITICPSGQSPLRGACTNVSMDGIYVETDQAVDVGIECGAKIILQGPNSTLTIDIIGVVVRSEDGFVALQFSDNLEWWAIFTIYAQYSGNSLKGGSLCCPEKAE